MVSAGQDHSGPDQSGLDTWLTGVVAICAATLLFSGVLLTGIGAAAHATDPSNPPPSVVETDRRQPPSGEPTTEPPPAGTTAAPAPEPDGDDRTTTTRQRWPSSTRQQPPGRTQRGPDAPPTEEARGPDPGSSPQFAPITVPTDDGGLDAAAAAAAAQNDLGALNEPSRQALGEQLFIGGLVGLLFSIGGLVTIALRRRVW